MKIYWEKQEKKLHIIILYEKNLKEAKRNNINFNNIYIYVIFS